VSAQKVRATVTKPLEGVRVLSFVNALAGPVATALLGDLGAEVIDIEEPNGRSRRGRADYAPLPGVPDRPWNRIGSENRRSKLNFTLDVGQPEGREVFLELVRHCDIMIENFSPRVLTKLGVAYEDLMQVKPDIILISMPAFGKTGPYKDRTSYGPGIDAMSGLGQLTGYPDRGPGKPGPVLNDYNAGALASFSALTALLHRRRTGKGQYIEVPMLEAEVHLIADALIDAQFNGRDRMRDGNRHPSMAPHAVYPCAHEDRWIAIACRNDEEFRRLADAIGRADLAEDPRYAAALARKQNEESLDQEISRWTSMQEHVEAQDLLQRHGVPAGAVLDMKELVESPHFVARNLFQTVSNPEVGAVKHMRAPWNFSRTPTPVTRPAGAFGEHNDYVLRDLLRMSDERVEALDRQRVIARVPLFVTEAQDAQTARSAQGSTQ